MKRQRTFATIQARMTSTRLPGKILLPAVGKPLLELMIERLKRVPAIDGIVIATTTNADDDPVVALARRLDVGCYRGSEHDVVGRLLGAVEAVEADLIVQTTGDCPLIDPSIVASVLTEYRAGKYDYVSNVLERTFPIGMDTQVFKTAVLRDAANRTHDADEREHVGLFIRRHPELYVLGNIAASREQHDPLLRLTVDTREDYTLIERIFAALYPRNPNFSLSDILDLLRKNPSWRSLNQHVEHRWLPGSPGSRLTESAR